MVNVCVYGSSSAKTPEKYLEASRKLGILIAENKHVCINGAGRAGCMGALNDGCSSAGGMIKGVIHSKFIVDFDDHKAISHMLIAEGNDLQERKKLLARDADCIIALPGGPGTWDELWEMACLKQLRFTKIPLCILNIDGFYDGFRIQLERAHQDKILYQHPDDIVYFATTPEEALNWCLNEISKNQTISEHQTFVPTREVDGTSQAVPQLKSLRDDDYRVINIDDDFIPPSRAVKKASNGISLKSITFQILSGLCLGILIHYKYR